MRITALIITVAVIATACATGATTGTTSTTTGTVPGLFGAELSTFESCDALLDYYIEQALPLVGPYGLPGYGYYGSGPFMAVAEDAVRGAPATTAVPAQAPGGEFSGTNVQVAGVDEADMVKTDGRRIFVLADGRLQIAIPTGDGVDMAGSLTFDDWWPEHMLLFEDTIVLAGQSWNAGPVPVDVGPYPGSQTPTTRIVQVDVSNVDRPKVVQTLTLDGAYVDSRIVDGVVRLAITSMPVGFDWAYPEGSGLRAERAATDENREIVKNSTLDNWLPYYVLEGAHTSEGRLLDCTNVMVPREFSGLNTLSILTFDLRDGIDRWASAGVVASGATMYATADHIYLATQRWMNWGVLEEADLRDEARRFRTQIHLFDTTDPGNPRYVASGDVDGFLINQFAMDEYQGVLRVASTTAPQGWWWSDESESLVTTLQPEGNRLAEIGRVDGLGEGEQIFAVRFIDEVGYVVTFRQTDPLYTIDLSDPKRPVVAGELKILGYSAYLHPVGEHRILGLGQDATEEGRQTGTQLSLFDVSDPANPQRIDQVTMEGGYSAAESEHHAFTYYQGLVLAPYESWGPVFGPDREDEYGYDAGVLAVRVDRDRLTFEGVLRTFADGPLSEKDLSRRGEDPWMWQPMRTVVIGDSVYAVARAGITVFDFDTLDKLAVVNY